MTTTVPIEKLSYTLNKVAGYMAFDELSKCELFVAANRNEVQFLYDMYSTESSNKLAQRVFAPRNNWKWNHHVATVIAGHIGPEELELNVALNFRFADIDGKKVAFYSADGRFADWHLIDNWFELYFPKERIDDISSLYYRWNNLFNKIQ